MDKAGEAERIIELLGCGAFQVLSVIFLYILCNFPAFYTSMFMIYGNFNPGWRCLDNLTAVMNDSNLLRNMTLTSAPSNVLSPPLEYKVQTCEAYADCQRIEFSPDSSTLVTEWRLLCDRSWILSVIICAQMAGMFVGAYAAGQLEDTYGRKKSLYTLLATNALFLLAASFSVAWYMFAALQFVTGFLISAIMTCYYVLLQELLTRKWRAPAFGVPAFHIAGVGFAVSSMLLRNWRHLQLASMAVTVVAFLPVIWVPESPRWLEVNNRKEAFIRVAEKIAHTNRKKLPEMKEINFIVSKCENSVDDTKIKRHTLLDIFHRGYRLYALIIGVQWFSVTCIFYAIYFGVKSLSGNFYINLLIMDAIEIPFGVVRMAAPNVIGRKKSTIVYLSVTTVCLYAMAALFVYSSGRVKTLGTVIFAMVAKLAVHAVFDLVYTYTPEVYPTVVRGLSVGWGSAMARLGGLVSAFLIPNDPDTYHINYAIMASIGLISCVATLGLPETRGKPLKETFDDEEIRLKQTLA